MKNNKIIFLVATVCCLVVCWLCFGAWSLEDIDYTSASFNRNLSTMYLYVLPSPNISDISNVNVSYVYTNAGSSTTVTASTRTLNQFVDYNNYGFLGVGSGSFNSNRAVQLSCAVSSVDRTLGDYFITSAYVYSSSSELVAVTSFSSNYIRYSFGASDYRTLIVFVDKVPTNGVSQEQYDELLQRYEDLEYDFSDLESDYDDLYIEVQEYIALYEQELALNTALNTRIEELQARIDTLESGGSALDFIGSAFAKVGDILQIEILPNGITIGTIVAVPLILGVVFLVLRLVRGE